MKPSACGRVYAVALVLAGAIGLAPNVHGIFLIPQIEEVPVSRVIANLDAVVRREPYNVQALVNLARAHAMAYTLGGDTLPMARGEEAGSPFVQPPAPHVPFARTRMPGTEPSPTAREHLRSAIRTYATALKLSPRDPIIRLGYGWCLMENGDRDAAVAAFRAVIPDAVKLDASGGNPFVGTIAAETAGYLIPLLDPQKDSAEIGRLRDFVADSARGPRAITPIVIPLRNGLGVPDLVDPHARVAFDADGSARGGRWTWVSPDAGWLVYDQPGHGRITSSLQMFGSVTFWMFWRNGYEAMRALDDDGDGVLAGGELTHLAIWRDTDGDAVSDTGEVRPLAEWGIVALSTRYRAEDESDDFVAESPTGVTFRDGTTRPTYDVLLHQVTR